MEEDKELTELGKKITELKDKSIIIDKRKPKGQQASPLRVGIEMVSGVGVGAFLGYFVDRFFHTFPIFFIIFFFFGAAGGFYNIYRLAQNKKIEDIGAEKNSGENK